MLQLGSSYQSVKAVLLQGISRLPPDRFSWHFMFQYFSKTCRQYSSLFNILKNNMYCTCGPTYIFITSRSVLLTMINDSDKICKETQSTHFVFSIFFFFENRAVYETLWKNMVEPDRPQMKLWRMHTACWITKATNTHPCNNAFPLQQWLHQRASMLRYT